MSAPTLQLLSDLKAALAQDGDRTHASLGLELGVSRARVTNLVRVLELPEPILGWVWSGKLTPKHGEALAGLPADKAEDLARSAMRGRWSAARLQQAVASAKGRRLVGDANPDVDLARLESRLGEQLGTAVRIEHRADQSGELVLRYTDLDTLDGLLDRLGYEPE